MLLVHIAVFLFEQLTAILHQLSGNIRHLIGQDVKFAMGHAYIGLTAVN